MADEYGQDFEKLSNERGSHDNLDDYNDAPGDSHKMRLSIDIHSIKDTTFKGLIYAKYGAMPSLGIKPFSTIPAIQITKTNVEEKFKNSFCSYEFVSNQQKLYNNLKEASVEIEVWHQDRFKKDMLIGIANVEIQRVLNSPERQAPQSFVRTYDAYIPLDEVDDNRNPVKRVALLRVIVYLEDMGPLDYLRQHEKEVRSKYVEELDEIATVPAAINLNHLNGNVNDAEKVNFMNELSNIEYKIIWELENWKKAEEAKFRYQLKSKEVDFLKKLNEEWKKKESDREKIFKKSEASIQQVESKLKQKTVELQKREQRLVLLEEELKQKINETSRQLAAKDEEINAVKKKQKDDKAQYEKDRAILTAKKEDFESKFQKLQEEFMAFRREQETSPVNLIKNELSAKDLEINRLKAEIEKANESKKEYEIYYQKLRGEILRLKKEKETMSETYARQSNAEIEQLKLRLSHMALLDNKENFQSFRNEFHDLKNQFQDDNLQQSGKNPFKMNYQEASAKNSLKAARTKSAQHRTDRTQGPRTQNEPTNEYERLVNERDNLLGLGIYGENDPLIVDLNDQIRKLERYQGRSDY